MNKFIIAVICMLMLSQAFAFKLKSASEHNRFSARLQGDNHIERPVGREEIPEGHTWIDPEEYYEDCPRNTATGFTDVSCDTSFEDEWKGVIFCARQFEVDYYDITRMTDFQLNVLKDNDATMDEATCVMAKTMFVAGFQQCSIYQYALDVAKTFNTLEDPDWKQKRSARTAVSNFMNFKSYWCAVDEPTIIDIQEDDRIDIVDTEPESDAPMNDEPQPE